MARGWKLLRGWSRRHWRRWGHWRRHKLLRAAKGKKHAWVALEKTSWLPLLTHPPASHLSAPPISTTHLPPLHPTPNPQPPTLPTPEPLSPTTNPSRTRTRAHTNTTNERHPAPQTSHMGFREAGDRTAHTHTHLGIELNQRLVHAPALLCRHPRRHLPGGRRGGTSRRGRLHPRGVGVVMGRGLGWRSGGVCQQGGARAL
jgi:hypothetical protein